MIDYVKILFKDIDTKRLFDIDTLDFKVEVSEKTGELSKCRIAKYHFCTISIYDSGLVFFKGSIHKLWNSLHNVLAPNYKEQKLYKGYNGNQFTINNILEVRNHLEILFDCQPKQMIFQNIEFGFNTNPGFCPQKFITGLLYQNNKLFEFKYNRYFAQSIHQRYILKIYNKSNQYGMLENTLRIELKVLRIEDIKFTGIKSFSDIDTRTLLKVKNLLLKRFKDVIYYDKTIIKNQLTNAQKRTLLNYKNQTYWIDDLKPKNRDYHKKKLLQFIANYSENLHQQIVENINQKFVIINRLSTNHKFVIINHSSIGLKITNKTPKKCRVSGVDISMQKEGSFLLSHTGLKYYYKYNRIEYNKIQNKYLSKKWIDANLETQIKKLAHNIRNKYNNQKIGRELKYKPQQFELLTF